MSHLTAGQPEPTTRDRHPPRRRLASSDSLIRSVSSVRVITLTGVPGEADSDGRWASRIPSGRGASLSTDPVSPARPLSPEPPPPWPPPSPPPWPPSPWPPAPPWPPPWPEGPAATRAGPRARCLGSASGRANVGRPATRRWRSSHTPWQQRLLDPGPGDGVVTSERHCLDAQRQDPNCHRGDALGSGGLEGRR
jgi:hypothetical protein